jgi:hypothetical protein
MLSHGVILRHPPPSGCSDRLKPAPDDDALNLFHQPPDTTLREDSTLIRLVGRLAIGILLVIVAGCVGTTIVARSSERAADEAWAEIGLSTEGFAKQHPKTLVTSAAQVVEEQAARLGIDFARGHTGPHPSEEEQKAFSAIFQRLVAHIDMSPMRALTESPPDELRKFLSAHAAEFNAIQGAAASGEIAWPIDAARTPPFGDLPPLFEVSELHDLFIADAMERRHAGDREAALARLEAACTLSGSLAARPEMVSQVSAVRLASHELGVARTLRPSTQAWRERVAAHSYRKSILSALQYEAWVASHYVRSETLIFYLNGMIDRPSTFLGRWVMGPLASPWLRVCVANYSRMVAETARDLQRENPCTFDANSYDASRADAVPRWNIFGRFAEFGTIASGGYWVSAGRLDLDRELTGTLLAIEADRQGGPWPASVPPIASEVCSGLVWTYAVDTKGTMSLTPSIAPRNYGLPAAIQATR